MTNLQHYEAIAESGNEQVIKSLIMDFELQKIRVGLNLEGQEILTLLKNSINWIRPVNMFEICRNLKPRI